MLMQQFPLKSGNCYIIDDTKRVDISKPTKDTPLINSPPAESVIDDIDIQPNGVQKFLEYKKLFKSVKTSTLRLHLLSLFYTETP